MSKFISVLGCLILLVVSGCSTPKVIEISASPVDKPKLILPETDQLNLRNVEWIVVTPENYLEIIDKLKKQGKPPVLFALTDNGYQAMSLNLSDVRAFIQQQKVIITAYDRYYKQAEDTIDAANNEVNSVNKKIEQENQKEKNKSGSMFGGFSLKNLIP